MWKKVRYRYGSICLAIIFVVVLTMLNQLISNKGSYQGGTAQKWLSEFTSKNFETCDSMVISQSDKILIENPLVIGTYKKSVDMYKALLNAGVDCIDEVLILEKKNGIVKVQVTLKSVESISSIKIDEKALNDLVDKYMSYELKKGGFKRKLNLLYLDSFKKSVLTDFDKDANKKVIYVKLKEENNKVGNTYSLVRQVLKETGLYENMKFFEESAQSTFNVYLRKDR